MKTLEIKNVLKADLLIVELPRVCDYELTKEGLFVKEHGSHLSDYIEGSYTLLGKPDEISEDDAAELIPMYFDYDKTATEHLLSALETRVYWENPIKKPNGEDYYYEENHGFDGVETLWDGGSYNEDLGQFEEAESRTFDRTRTLIFKKN